MKANAPSPDRPEGVLLITAAEAARRLAISERKLWALTASRMIPHVRVGRAVRYRPQALSDWIDENERS